MTPAEQLQNALERLQNGRASRGIGFALLLAAFAPAAYTLLTLRDLDASGDLVTAVTLCAQQTLRTWPFAVAALCWVVIAPEIAIVFAPFALPSRVHWLALLVRTLQFAVLTLVTGPALYATAANFPDLPGWLGMAGAAALLGAIATLRGNAALRVLWPLFHAGPLFFAVPGVAVTVLAFDPPLPAEAPCPRGVDVQCLEPLTSLPEPPLAVIPGAGGNFARVVGRQTILTIDLTKLAIDGPYRLPGLEHARVAAGASTGEVIVANDDELTVLDSNLAPVGSAQLRGLFEVDSARALGRDDHVMRLTVNNSQRRIYVTSRFGSNFARFSINPTVAHAPVALGAGVALAMLQPEREVEVYALTRTGLRGFDMNSGEPQSERALPFPVDDAIVTGDGRAFVLRDAVSEVAAQTVDGTIVARARYRGRGARIAWTGHTQTVIVTHPDSARLTLWRPDSGEQRELSLGGRGAEVGGGDNYGGTFAASTCGLVRLHLTAECFAGGAHR